MTIQVHVEEREDGDAIATVTYHRLDGSVVAGEPAPVLVAFDSEDHPDAELTPTKGRATVAIPKGVKVRIDSESALNGLDVLVD